MKRKSSISRSKFAPAGLPSPAERRWTWQSTASFLDLLSILVLNLLLALAVTGVAQAAPRQQAETPVYGWVGTVYAYSRPAYDDYFVRNDGELFGVAGETAAMEKEMEALRGVLVKVWGTSREDTPDFNGRQIVVSEILAVEAQPTATPPPKTKPEVLIIASVANLRTGPSTAYARIATAYAEQIYDIVGRNQDSSWWQICCPAARSLWVYSDLVEASGPLANVAVVPVTPPPTPIPEPVITEWRGEYYPNLEFQGRPLVRNDGDVDFNWGDKAPFAGLPADDFTVRWTRSVYFDSGDYRFHIHGGDGARLLLNDQPVIDHWLKDDQDTFTGTFRKLGSSYHTVVVEWYHRGGIALVNLWWEPIKKQGGPQPD